MIAKVIVDVPSSQTDRLYDYEIPDMWINVIEKGMRVIVPFGNRKVQGFIVDILNAQESTGVQLKKIEKLLDLEPVLTDELVELGLWLSKQTLCYKIIAMQAMLPSSLKVDYEKYVQAKHAVRLPQDIQTLFHGRTKLNASELEKLAPHELRKIKTLLKQGDLEWVTEIKERTTEKKAKMIRPAVDKNTLKIELDKLNKRASKQREIIEWFIENEEEIPLAELTERLNVSTTAVMALVKKQILIETYQKVYRDPYAFTVHAPTQPLTLTPSQKRAIKPILSAVEKEENKTFLLHGVTGSGKTEIYLQSIAAVLKKGKEAIVLVPEISLTPQMVKRFKERFGNHVAVLHSGLSAGEKYDEWLKIQRKQVKVAVGVRSAIFAPFENLGMIILDEEHESSYKQEESPRYHAREVAEWRSRYHRCPLILGSATPSLESYARSIKGVYTLCELKERVHSQMLPEIVTVDMRNELKSGNRSIYSRLLIDSIQDTIQNGQQCVLLLNRRGYSTFVICRDCGYAAECPYCDISLTYHKQRQILKCHYCNFETSVPTVCPECKSKHIRFFGTGTQKAEEELLKIIPEARIIRMDVDTTSRKGAHEQLLTAFFNKQADVLLGTQMIAKGLDFPDVTLVGVINADTMLHLPDFRSAERTFQLLTQVAGRAGRRQLTGKVIIQTYTPEHYSIQYASRHQYHAFFNREMKLRKAHAYPPYYFLTSIIVSHQDLMKVIAASERIKNMLVTHLSNHAIVLGPSACVIPRMKDRYRYQCMIKYKNEPKLHDTLQMILAHFEHERDLVISIDQNPQLFM